VGVQPHATSRSWLDSGAHVPAHGGRALQIALNYCCQRERPWRRVPSSRACRAGHSASRTGPSLGDMWHVVAVQRKHDGHLCIDGRRRRTTTPSHGSFQGAENRHAPCWITQSRLGLQPVGQSHLRSESHQQGDNALRLYGTPGHANPDQGRRPWTYISLDSMHGVWANDRPGIYGACHVLPAGQHPPTEGCSRAAIWIERQPNGMDRCGLSYYSEVLSWAIPEVVLKRTPERRTVPPHPGEWRHVPRLRRGQILHGQSGRAK
jgi:hypothetical protein